MLIEAFAASNICGSVGFVVADRVELEGLGGLKAGISSFGGSGEESTTAGRSSSTGSVCVAWSRSDGWNVCQALHHQSVNGLPSRIFSKATYSK